MDLSKAKAIVKEAAKPMKMALGLHDWKLEIEWRHLEGVMAKCRALPAERMACIEFDNDAHGTKKDLLETLLHELLHCVHAHTGLLRHGVRQHLTEECWETYEDLHIYVIECIVRSLEEMLMASGMTIPRLIARGERLLEA